MKELLKKVFQRFGLHLESQWLHEQRELVEKILSQLFLKKHYPLFSEKNTTIICFSKDRPMQLDALLFSMNSMVGELKDLPITVLYQASNEDFKRGYQSLINLDYCTSVKFIEEEAFREDLLSIMAKMKSEKVLFLVDDLFFKNKLDWSFFTALDLEKYIPSLRHGKHLDYAYTVQEDQALPKFRDENGMISWVWNEAEKDWNYPLSLDGHLYRSAEIYTLFKNIEFKAPNSLEQSMQTFSKVFGQRKGIAFQESIILNNPANKVQNENDNFHGETDNEVLNQAWLNNYRFNFEAYQGIRNRSVHELVEIKLIEDERR